MAMIAPAYCLYYSGHFLMTRVVWQVFVLSAHTQSEVPSDTSRHTDGELAVPKLAVSYRFSPVTVGWM